MRIYRTVFKKEIVTEFMAPTRPSRKVMIILDGCPALPTKQDLMHALARKGYWVFYPRYRGAWESGGKFLMRSPHEDVIDVIGSLPRGFRDIWTGRRFVIRPRFVGVVGGSFGGTVALLCSGDRRVSCAIALSPVVDWRAPSKTEPMERWIPFMRAAYPGGYREVRGGWEKVMKGEFLNPVSCEQLVDGKKTLIIQARDDETIGWRPVERFANRVDAALKLVPHGGHFSAREIVRPRFQRLVASFLRDVGKLDS